LELKLVILLRGCIFGAFDIGDFGVFEVWYICLVALGAFVEDLLVIDTILLEVRGVVIADEVLRRILGCFFFDLRVL